MFQTDAGGEIVEVSFIAAQVCVQIPGNIPGIAVVEVVFQNEQVDLVDVPVIIEVKISDGDNRLRLGLFLLLRLHFNGPALADGRAEEEQDYTTHLVPYKITAHSHALTSSPSIVSIPRPCFQCAYFFIFNFL
jgi:hypothetical protein